MSGLKIISVGAAVQDVFLSGKVLTPTKENGQWVEELPLGAKLDVDRIVFSTGGGATNASVTFARQGFISSFMGQIGRDPAGQAVLDDLRQEKVNSDLLVYSDEYATGYSVLLLAPSGERTILTYRGASTHYNISKFKFDRAIADWFYISSLAGDMDLLGQIVEHCRHNHIKIGFNPGKGELAKLDQLKFLLDGMTVLIGNKQEMTTIFGGDDIWQTAKNGSHSVPYVVVTDGPNGVVATDRGANQICRGGMYEDVPVLDRTGAGDAFASGFVASIASGSSLHEAVVLGSANSTSVVQKIGAKSGILYAGSGLHGMDLHVEPLEGN